MDGGGRGRRGSGEVGERGGRWGKGIGGGKAGMVEEGSKWTG